MAVEGLLAAAEPTQAAPEGLATELQVPSLWCPWELLSTVGKKSKYQAQRHVQTNRMAELSTRGPA